jgi:hypothetical protein
VRQSYTLTIIGDHTLLIKVGRAVEHVDLQFKEKGQIFDYVKYALISKEVFISNARLTEDLYDVVWKHQQEA